MRLWFLQVHEQSDSYQVPGSGEKRFEAYCVAHTKPETLQ